MTGSSAPIDDSAVIDACAFHEWASPLDLTPYTRDGWREMVIREGDPGGPLNFSCAWLYQHPTSSKARSTYENGAIPGTDPFALQRDLLELRSRSAVVLGYEDALRAMAFPHHYIAREVARAANDWTVNEWLARDERLFGLVLIATSLPEDAAAEIRRAGQHDRMVGVALGANALGRPFGHPIYHPIYRAAAELELPLVLQVGSDMAGDLITPPVAGGLPATFAEFNSFGAQPLMGHVASLIVQGVFDLFPGLRVLLVGGGASWIPSFLWKFNYWKKSREMEAPWMKRAPSEYFPDHFRIGTHSLETMPSPKALEKALTTIPEIQSLLTYTSGYPSWEWTDAPQVAERLPVSWSSRVLRDNALALYRFPSSFRQAVEARGVRQTSPVTSS